MGSTASIVAKAHRLRDAGHVRELANVRVFAVQGDHDTYTVVIDGDTTWCSCPSESVCSHVAAALLDMKLGGGQLGTPPAILSAPPREPNRFEQVRWSPDA